MGEERLPASTSLFERRTAAEWQLLKDLAAINPERLTDLQGEDSCFLLTLRLTRAALVDGEIVADHRLRIGFPMHYPALPMTLHLQRPALHPNIHPESGFVCLWTEHRIGNNVEHALHKVVAMLSGRLYNLEPVHVMQTDAASQLVHDESVAPLRGLSRSPALAATPPVRRSRLW